MRFLFLSLSLLCFTSQGVNAHPSSTPLLKRATTAACPPSSLVGQFWPSWEAAIQPLQNVSFANADLAFYFSVGTTSKGFGVPTGNDLVQMQTFVKAAHLAKKKALFTIGGWTGSVYFSSLVATSTARTNFAKTIASFMKTYGFDGVDLDWEFIGRQGAGNNRVSSYDAENFLAFLKILRSTIGTTKLITADVPMSGLTGRKGVTLTSTKAFATYLDYITIMAYDMYDYAWSPTTGPNAPLAQCNSQSASVTSAVALWISSGFPPCKILLGVPGYSHIFRTAKSKIYETTYSGVRTLPFQTLAPLADQPTDSTFTYNELINKGWLTVDGSKGAGGFVKYWDTCTSTPFLFSPSTRTFAAYDDAVSIGLKAAFARSKGLAGINFYDSTGPDSSIFSAARAGLAGTFRQSKGVRTRKRDMDVLEPGVEVNEEEMRMFVVAESWEEELLS